MIKYSEVREFFKEYELDLDPRLMFAFEESFIKSGDLGDTIFLLDATENTNEVLVHKQAVDNYIVYLSNVNLYLTQDALSSVCFNVFSAIIAFALLVYTAYALAIALGPLMAHVVIGCISAFAMSICTVMNLGTFISSLRSAIANAKKVDSNVLIKSETAISEFRLKYKK